MNVSGDQHTTTLDNYEIFISIRNILPSASLEPFLERNRMSAIMQHLPMIKIGVKLY